MDKAIQIIEKKIQHLESVLTTTKPYFVTIGVLKDLIIEIKKQ